MSNSGREQRLAALFQSAKELAGENSCKKELTEVAGALDGILEGCYEAHGRVHLTAQELNGTPIFVFRCYSTLHSFAGALTQCLCWRTQSLLFRLQCLRRD